MMSFHGKIDLHMHSLVSDGTDTPAGIIERVKEAGIELFSLTDHDATEGCSEIKKMLKSGDPTFLFGAEFSCEDEKGKYHILGYDYDPDAESIDELVKLGRSYRIVKVQQRLDFLRSDFGFVFSDEDVRYLLGLENPGKPHIAGLMVKYGYAADKGQAFKEFLNRFEGIEPHVRPEIAIKAIIDAGGIPVLAHPSFGSGEQLIIGDEMEERIRWLLGYGLQGVEAFYSCFPNNLRLEMLAFAEKYDLYVTAGSDYHGTNKTVCLGDTGLGGDYPAGLGRFLQKTLHY